MSSMESSSPKKRCADGSPKMIAPPSLGLSVEHSIESTTPPPTLLFDCETTDSPSEESNGNPRKRVKTDKKSVLWVDEAMGSDLSSVREFEKDLDERENMHRVLEIERRCIRNGRRPSSLIINALWYWNPTSSGEPVVDDDDDDANNNQLHGSDTKTKKTKKSVQWSEDLCSIQEFEIVCGERVNMHHMLEDEDEYLRKNEKVSDRVLEALAFWGPANSELSEDEPMPASQPAMPENNAAPEDQQKPRDRDDEPMPDDQAVPEIQAVPGNPLKSVDVPMPEIEQTSENRMNPEIEATPGYTAQCANDC